CETAKSERLQDRAGQALSRARTRARDSTSLTSNRTMPQEAPGSPIGRDTPRVDGPLKVTGVAHYASDFHFPGLLYAVPVEATIAKGKITKLDTAAAEEMPGVRAILHRQNIGKIFRSTPGTNVRSE